MRLNILLRASSRLTPNCHEEARRKNGRKFSLDLEQQTSGTRLPFQSSVEKCIWKFSLAESFSRVHKKMLHRARPYRFRAFKTETADLKLYLTFKFPVYNYLAVRLRQTYSISARPEFNFKLMWGVRNTYPYTRAQAYRWASTRSVLGHWLTHCQCQSESRGLRLGATCEYWRVHGVMAVSVVLRESANWTIAILLAILSRAGAAGQ